MVVLSPDRKEIGETVINSSPDSSAAWRALDDSGLTTDRINLAILVGGKDGNFLERVKGQLVGERIVERKPEHELSDDDRLDYYEERDRGEI